MNLEGLGEGKHQVKLVMENSNDQVELTNDKEMIQVEIFKE